MLFKIGNFIELDAVFQDIPVEAYLAVHQIISVLDSEYGPDRDIDLDDGGYVLIAENIKDVRYIQRQYQDIENDTPECVNILQADKPLIHALYLKNNEFGVSVIIPLDLAPGKMKKEIIEYGEI